MLEMIIVAAVAGVLGFAATSAEDAAIGGAGKAIAAGKEKKAAKKEDASADASKEEAKKEEQPVEKADAEVVDETPADKKAAK